MRNFVLALLAANVLYFAWAFWGADHPPVLTEVPMRSTPPVPPAPPPCTTLGPFIDASLAEQAEGRLAGAGLDAQRREITAEVNDGWWVYVATADAAARTRALDAIRRAGNRDAFAMPNDAQFRVSVGVLSDQTRAEELATRIRALRLEPVVEARLKQQDQVWFDLNDMTQEALADGRLEDLDLPLLDLRIEACPEP